MSVQLPDDSGSDTRAAPSRIGDPVSNLEPGSAGPANLSASGDVLAVVPGRPIVMGGDRPQTDLFAQSGEAHTAPGG